MRKLLVLDKNHLSKMLWKEDPKIMKILKKSKSLHDARDSVFEYLNGVERHYFNIYSDRHFKKLHIIEKNNAKECIRVMKNIIRSENEKLTGFSALKALLGIAKGSKDAIDSVSEGFLSEFIFLFRGINGKMELKPGRHLVEKDGRGAALLRSRTLDEYSGMMNKYFGKYDSGVSAEAVKKRKKMKSVILGYFKGRKNDWNNHKWHMNHIIKDTPTLETMVKLSKEEKDGLILAEKNNIPFHITPHYLSLFSPSGRTKDDVGARSQVLPSKKYCEKVIENRKKSVDMDFMGERSTSPIDGITRRYPQILILKPYDSCPQICVYCQRNWEIKGMDEAKITRKNTFEAIDWINMHESITEVLVTGGDPLTLSNDYLDDILSRLSEIGHVERIRIGTRIFVTLPQRIDSGFVRMLSMYHAPGKREICMVTHFEHASEMTEESQDAIRKIRTLGIGIYNQQVFTYYNSFKFQTSFLRKVLKLNGIDPYYSFNTKGKDETEDFRVPIARIEQERKEEARLLPGMVRTDEPVFNVPKLGKSHLRAWQEHEPVMILPGGERVYRFYPWESRIVMVDDYLYTDVPIYNYLRRLMKDGEDPDDYRTIWYYF